MTSRAGHKQHKSQEVQIAERPANREATHDDKIKSAITRLQRTAGNQAVTRLLAASPGQPLDAETRAEMESRFQENFADVRVHLDRAAEQSAETFGAKAWTAGRDIVFGEGHSPQSTGGKKLLAHELAHVVQQRRGGPQPNTFDTGNVTEHDASAAAGQFEGGTGAVTVNTASGPGVAREEEELPWWKKRLNPLYQRALEVLPPEAAGKLQQANATVKEFVKGAGVSDERLNEAVRTAEPTLAFAGNLLGVQDKSTQPASSEVRAPVPTTLPAPRAPEPRNSAPSSPVSQPVTQKDGTGSTTIPEVTVEGCTPDQIAVDITRRTGIRAYDLAKALGLKPAPETWGRLESALDTVEQEDAASRQNAYPPKPEPYQQEFRLPLQSRDDEWDQRVAFDEAERLARRREENPNLADVVLKFDPERVQKAFGEGGNISAGVYGIAKISGASEQLARNLGSAADVGFAVASVFAAKGSATRFTGLPASPVRALQSGAPLEGIRAVPPALNEGVVPQGGTGVASNDFGFTDVAPFGPEGATTPGNDNFIPFSEPQAALQTGTGGWVPETNQPASPFLELVPDTQGNRTYDGVIVYEEDGKGGLTPVKPDGRNGRPRTSVVTREEQLFGRPRLSGKGTRTVIRRSSPTKTIQKDVKARLPIGAPDPLFPDTFLTEPAAADHIIPLDTIRKKPGFARIIDEARQIEILNFAENFEPLSKKANDSKGNKTYRQWAEDLRQKGVPFNEQYMNELIAREAELDIAIDRLIQESPQW